MVHRLLLLHLYDHGEELKFVKAHFGDSETEMQ